MLLTTLILSALPLAQVDLVLGPNLQSATPSSTISITLTAKASSPPTVESLSGIDAILSWDPTELDFIDATAGYPWFVSGFLPDPDGINLDVEDGEALYTVLTTPGVPATVPPDILVATFRFTFLKTAHVRLLPSAGAFGTTKVLSIVPGQVITGDISSTASVRNISVIPAMPNAALVFLAILFLCLGALVLRRRLQPCRVPR